MSVPRSIQIQARLVHAEAGRRIVEVTARQGAEELGSALGEAPGAEEAEDRALERLLARLAASDGQPSPGTAGGPTDAAAGAESPPLRNAGMTQASIPIEANHGPVAERLPPETSQPVDHDPAAPAPGGQAEARQERAITQPPSDPAVSERPASRSQPAPSGRSHGQPPAAATTPESPEDPEDWSSELAGLDLQLRRLGWAREAESTYLERAFGHPSRSRLTSYADLRAYLAALEGLPADADPSCAPVPLRRRDLLAQSDQLLGQLGWRGDQARRFLEQQLGASSRQQLNDGQLLQFNMLLESELLERGPGDGRMPAPPAASP